MVLMTFPGPANKVHFASTRLMRVLGQRNFARMLKFALYLRAARSRPVDSRRNRLPGISEGLTLLQHVPIAIIYSNSTQH
jgi:hypothetical protein